MLNYDELAKKASQANAKVALMIGPNKASVYPEYLPIAIKPSDTRYLSYFTKELSQIRNLYLVDPTETLVKAKAKEGLLYYRTDSHWNEKGAYIAFTAMMEKLGLKYPTNLQFYLEGEFKGDIVTKISKIKNFSLHPDDNWNQNTLTDVGWEIIPDQYYQADSNIFKTILSRIKILRNPMFESQNEDPLEYFWSGVVKNTQGLNDLVVWVPGDSFTNSLKRYLNASFTNVRYMDPGKIDAELSASGEKPNLVIVVKVERSF